jgi:poly(3-hydroxyalkanoate) synthetase
MTSDTISNQPDRLDPLVSLFQLINPSNWLSRLLPLDRYLCGLELGHETAVRELNRARSYRRTVHPTEPPAPTWATPSERIELRPSVNLRIFGESPTCSSTAAPPENPLSVLVVTPQVNHSYIADFSEKQSLVRTLLACGATRVGVTDWLPPPSREYSIADSIEDIVSCADRLAADPPGNGPIHLVGLCQGGWQGAIVTALHPKKIATLTLAAAPIDAHAGSTPLHAFTLGMPMAFFETLVQLGGGMAIGRLLSSGFDTLKPFERFFYNKANLYLNADDERFVERYQSLRNWYRLNKDLPGKLYLEAVRDLFKKNLLVQGKMEVCGRRVDLSEIGCPIFLLAGKRDHITPAEQVFALEGAAPNAPCQKHLVDAGHIGVFMGTRSLATVWPEVVESIKARSLSSRPGRAGSSPRRSRASAGSSCPDGDGA